MLQIEGDVIRYRLSLLETIGAFGGEPTARISNLVSVKSTDRPWRVEVMKGIRAPGTGFPFVIMLGTLRYRGGKDFCVVYKRNPVLILEFKDEKFNRWIIPANPANPNLISEIRKPEALD